MIDDKKIEEAASVYGTSNGYSVIGPDGRMSLKPQLETAFEAGAHWAINEFLKDLWHDKIEQPKEKVPILYYRKHKFLPFMVDKHSDVYDWNALVYNFDITKWLYIEDLLAKEGDDQ